MHLRILFCLTWLAICPSMSAQSPTNQGSQRDTKTGPKYDASVPAPTRAGVRYGQHERHILDFWKAESSTPTPAVFVIHGGGWVGGSKERVHRFADVAALLKARSSVSRALDLDNNSAEAYHSMSQIETWQPKE